MVRRTDGWIKRRGFLFPQTLFTMGFVKILIKYQTRLEIKHLQMIESVHETVNSLGLIFRYDKYQCIHTNNQMIEKKTVLKREGGVPIVLYKITRYGAHLNMLSWLDKGNLTKWWTSLYICTFRFQSEEYNKEQFNDVIHFMYCILWASYMFCSRKWKIQGRVSNLQTYLVCAISPNVLGTKALNVNSRMLRLFLQLPLSRYR